MWKVLRKLGREGEADVYSKEALRCHRCIHGGDQRRLEEMADEDFDMDVMFWSR